MRAAVLAEYKATGNKQFGCAVVRVTRRLGYAIEAAYQWAVKHQMALKLDEKAFEAIVKASPNDAELEAIAVIEEVPTAAIASDLTAYEGGEVAA